MLKFKKFGERVHIPNDIDVIFVADLFVHDYVGGAELTSEALIDASPYRIFKLHSRDVTLELLSQGHDKYWIFGNFAELNFDLIPSIVANIRYSILEYDYKYCKYRSPELHKVNEGVECDCGTSKRGQIVSAFFYGARSLWWMSEAQQDRYLVQFPFLSEKQSTVLSSVFDENTLNTIELLRSNVSNDRSGWIVLGSPSWIKGASDAEKWCNDHNLRYHVIWGKEYSEVLQMLSSAEGFVYLPRGADTCPRMVIEAKLLGCKLHINENVQHASEEWFATDDIEGIRSYLSAARSFFWNGITANMAHTNASISGYTTTYNCISSDYPFVESIMSMLGFCDQIVVVDAGSSDGTWEKLQELAAQDERLLIHKQVRDRSRRRWAIDFDGRLKALARSLCTSDFCWQQDCDEVVHERDYDKIKRIVRFFPQNVDLVCLPVIEYWGRHGKLRVDVHNWKWRLSRNRPGITHGIPAELRKYDADGEMYAARGTDSCDYIWLGDYSRVQYGNFYTQDVEAVRIAAVNGDNVALQRYQGWYQSVIDQLPCVHHYSWFNIRRKASSYRTHWSEFWTSMYGDELTDAVATNNWLPKSWDHVSDDELNDVADRLEREMGGWIFHRPIDWSIRIPSITCNVTHPHVMWAWIDRNADITSSMKSEKCT